jgi:hypothetical protein
MKMHRERIPRGLLREASMTRNRREIEMGLKKGLYGWLVLGALVVLGWGALAGTCWAGSAIIKVISDPDGAKVTADTGQEGITPCALEVPEGKRSLVIKARAYIAKNVQVDASSVEPTEVKVKLVPIPTTMEKIRPQYCELQGLRD